MILLFIRYFNKNYFQVLGRGGFGKVVLGEKKDNKEFYAIKEIKLDQKRKDLLKNLSTEKYDLLLNIKVNYGKY